VATNVTTELPEGFVLDAQVPSYRTEKDMLAAMRLSPDEAAADAADEANPKNDRYLAQEIARTTDPAKLAILQTEQADRSAKYGGGGRFVNASATTSTGLPEGFVLDAPTPAKPLSLYDHMNTPLKVGSAVAGGDKFDATVGTLPYLLNAAKTGLMSVPGIPGSVVAAGRAFGLTPSPIAMMTTGPIGLALAFINHEQAKQKAGEVPFMTGANLAEKILGADSKMKAPGPATEFAGDVTSFVASLPGGPASLLAKGAPLLAAKAVAKLGVMGTAVTAGGEAGQATFGEGPLGKTVGEIVSLPFIAYGMPRIKALNLLTAEGRNAASEAAKSFTAKAQEGIIQPFVSSTVADRMAKSVADFEPAVANIKSAAELQKTINTALVGTGKEIQLSAGRASGAPIAMADELAAKGSSNAAVAAAMDSDRRNADAVMTYIKQGVQPSGMSGTMAVDRAIVEHNAMIAAKREEADFLRARAEKLIPLVDRQVAAREAQIVAQEQQAKAGLPGASALTPEQRGVTLTRQQAVEKVKEDAISKQLYASVDAEAERIGAQFSQDGIALRARALAANPILAYDETNLPSVIRAIRATSNPTGDVVAPSLLERGMNAAIEPSVKRLIPPLDYPQISAMRTAVNQDISAEMASTNPNKRQRVSALLEMKATIDGTIAGSEYVSVTKLFNAATENYRNNYSPKFNHGINSKLMMNDSYGNPKVFSESILDQYMGKVTNANAFLKLFGKNPEALAVMEDHILSRFGRDVIKDGAVDLRAYASFMKRNGDVLNTLSNGGMGTVKQLTGMAERQSGLVAQRAGLVEQEAMLRSGAGKLAQQLSDRQNALLTNAKEIAQSDLGKLLGTNDYDKIVQTALSSPDAMARLTGSLGQMGSRSLASSVMHDLTEKITYAPTSGKIGLDNKALYDWLQKHSEAASIMFKNAYGAQEGAAHLQRLKDASRMLSVLDRVPTPGLSARDIKIGQDPLQQSVGITIRSLFNVGRAIIGGRTSQPDAAVLFSGQAISHLMTKEYNKMMQSVASDPESSKLLLDMLQNGTKGGANKEAAINSAKAMMGLLGKIGLYAVGNTHYIPSALKIAPTAINDLAQPQK